LGQGKVQKIIIHFTGPQEQIMQTTLVVEFMLWLLIAASIIAVVAARLRVPYTVALVLGGQALGMVRTPFLQNVTGQRPDWLTPEIALVIFLPPLLFEGSVKIQFRHLRENFMPILLLANVGVLVATLITGLVIHWKVRLPTRSVCCSVSPEQASRGSAYWA
jgi:Na+:H+ antiporter